jgi:hypothetical protein
MQNASSFARMLREAVDQGQVVLVPSPAPPSRPAPAPPPHRDQARLTAKAALSSG